MTWVMKKKQIDVIMTKWHNNDKKWNNNDKNDSQMV